MLPKIGATRESPAIIEADGHATRKTGDVISICEKYHVYFLLQPSHTSTLLAPLDNGVNALLQRLYTEGYTSSVAALQPLLSYADDEEKGHEAKLNILTQAMEKLRKVDTEKIKSCWRKCFQPNGKLDTKNIAPDLFEIGKKFRDENLPTVSKEMLTEMFSNKNLVIPFGSHALKLVQDTEVASYKTYVHYLLEKVGSGTTAVHRALFTRFVHHTSVAKRLEIHKHIQMNNKKILQSV